MPSFCTIPAELVGHHPTRSILPATRPPTRQMSILTYAPVLFHACAFQGARKKSEDWIRTVWVWEQSSEASLGRRNKMLCMWEIGDFAGACSKWRGNTSGEGTPCVVCRNEQKWSWGYAITWWALTAECLEIEEHMDNENRNYLSFPFFPKSP